MRRKLIVSDGTREKELQLVGRIVVGRDPSCEISHDDSLLSRRHAEFLTAGQQVTVRDLGSRNGVFVNGARAAEHLLEAGDIVQIGPLRARYVVEEVAAGILSEVLEGDRTAVIRRVFTEAPIEVEIQPGAAAAVGLEDEEVTRMVAAPLMPGAPADPQGPYAALDEAESPTRFVAAPGMDGSRSAAASVAAAPAAGVSTSVTRGSVPSTAAGGLSAFVLFQLLVLAGVVLGSAAVPMLMWRRAAGNAVASMSLSWLALPVGIALVGAYVVSTLITQRITSALEAIERNRT